MPSQPTYEALQRRVRELEQAHRAFRETEEQYRRLIDFSPMPFLLTQEEKIVFANPAAARLFGTRDPGEMVGSSPMDWIHPDFAERAYQRRRYAVETGRALDPVELVLVRKDGKEAVVIANATPISHLGAPALLSVFQDITDRKISENALRESEHRYRALVENAQDAIYVIQEGVIRFANPTASSITGYSREALEGRDFAELLHEEDRKRIRKRYEDRLAGKEVPTDDALRFLRRDGRDVWMQVNQVVIDWDGEPATLNIARDISRQRKVEEALLESEKKYRQLIELSPNLIAVHQEGTFVFVNESGLRLLGASDPSEVIGKPITDFVEPARRTVARERIRKLVAEGDRSPVYEQTLMRLDGVQRDLEVVGTPFLYEGREAVQIIASDITDRKRVEEKLDHLRELLEKTSRMARVGGWSVDLVTGVHEWSEVTREIHEVEPEFVPDLEKAIRFYKAGESREKIIEAVNRCVETGEPYDVEVQFISAKGTERWIRTMGSGEFRDGTCVRLHGTFQDMTELKHSERERERLLSAIEQAGEVIVITDPDGAIHYVNPAFERVTGYDLEEVKGQNPRILKSGRQDEPFYRRLWKTITAGDTWQGRMVNKRKDGSLYTEEATISPVFDGQGRIANFVAVKRDISAELDLESRLAQAQKMEAIGTLAGGIAHDFNNILSAIMGFTEIVEEDLPEGSQDKEDLGEVLAACGRAKDLVKQILTFSRQSDHDAKPLRLNAIAMEVLKMIRSSLPTSIEIRQVIQSDLPAVVADPTQVHQIMMNLCTNAAHALKDEHGTIEVILDEVRAGGPAETESPGDLTPGRYVRLKVSDTGCGMTDEVRERMFEPYFTTKKAGEGTGLGLAVVYGIVKEYGGDVVVESEPGKGASFSVFFPASRAKERSALDQPHPALPPGSERILFVDDEPSLAKLGAAYLERLGYEVTIRRSSLEALELFRKAPRRFDLVVTDMTMPQMTGDELAREMLAIRPDIPIVLCTGYSKRISEEKARAMGIRAFVMKPLTRLALANTVRRVLDES